MKKLALMMAALCLFWISADSQRHKPPSASKHPTKDFFSGRTTERPSVVYSGFKPQAAIMADIYSESDDVYVPYFPDDYYPAPAPATTSAPSSPEDQAIDEALREAQRQQQEALRQLQEMIRRQQEMINNIIRNF